MINRQEWLRTRKKLLDQVKSQVQARLGPPSAALRRYAKSLEGEFLGQWSPSRDEHLRRALQAAHIVLSADFHAYAQSQRAHIRILRDHVVHDHVVLTLECLPVEADESIRRFLTGRISEAKFLEEVEWDKNWGFPWEHYRPLFELARDRGYEVRGLTPFSTDGLSRRDRWMARRILGLSRANPGALVFVVVGELHLASRHLPRLLRGSLKKPHDLMLIFQDVESLYFKLAKKPMGPGSEVLRGPGNRYCLMVSPPWMKWQSYLIYLEHAYDRDLQEDPAIDYSDHVASLIQILEGDLKIETKKSAVQVYCPNSKISLTRLKAALPKRFARAFVYHLEHDLSFFVPEKEWFYLSRATINHASALAGQFVHAHLSGRRRTLWIQPQDFLAQIWVEAVGFFFSKWINPKRKAETLDSIRLQLAARQPKDWGRKALLLSLDHRLTEVVWVQTGRLRRSRYRPRELVAYIEASRLVGEMLGDRLFQKVRSGVITLPQLMAFLSVDVEGANFSEFYWNLIRAIEHEQSL